MLTVRAHMWERSAVDNSEMWLLLLPHSPSPFFSPCDYHCLPVWALRPDTGLRLSKSSPSLTGPYPSWVNPSRAGETSAGSVPHRAVQKCTPPRNPPLSPALCQDLSPLVTATQSAFSGFPQECFHWPSLLTVHVCHRAVRAPRAVPLHLHVSQQGGDEPLLPSTEVAVLENKVLTALQQ